LASFVQTETSHGINWFIVQCMIYGAENVTKCVSLVVEAHK